MRVERECRCIQQLYSAFSGLRVRLEPKMDVVITAPSLNLKENVSGVSAVVRFIMKYNTACRYRHFTIGKRDAEKRDVRSFLHIIRLYGEWVGLLMRQSAAIAHIRSEERRVGKECRS